jgi:hypothetical protein
MLESAGDRALQGEPRASYREGDDELRAGTRALEAAP